MSGLLPTGKDRQYMFLALRIAGDFGATIAVPVVVFVIIGQWLDKKYLTGPLFLIMAFVMAAILSGIMIYGKSKRYGREYSEIDKKNENNSTE